MRKESESCIITGTKQITRYSKTVLVPQKVPKEGKRKPSQAYEKAFP